METYSAVKKSVFEKRYCKYAVVNVDDELGREIMRNSDAKVLTYGIDNPADVFAIDVDESDKGISYIINLFDAIYDVKTSLIGECNVYNTLAAAAQLSKNIRESLFCHTCSNGRLCTTRQLE